MDELAACQERYTYQPSSGGKASSPWLALENGDQSSAPNSFNGTKKEPQ